MDAGKIDELNAFLSRVDAVTAEVTGLTDGSIDVTKLPPLPDEQPAVRSSRPKHADPMMEALERDAEERAQRRREKEERANVEKAKGNDAFKRGDFALAVACYGHALEIAPHMMELRTNRAHANNKMRQWQAALDDCTVVIDFQAAPALLAKAYVRRATALSGLRRYDEAVADFTEAQKVEPQNKEVTAMLKQVAAEKTRYLAEKETMSRVSDTTPLTALLTTARSTDAEAARRALDDLALLLRKSPDLRVLLRSVDGLSAVCTLVETRLAACVRVLCAAALDDGNRDILSRDTVLMRSLLSPSTYSLDVLALLLRLCETETGIDTLLSVPNIDATLTAILVAHKPSVDLLAHIAQISESSRGKLCTLSQTVLQLAILLGDADAAVAQQAAATLVAITGIPRARTSIDGSVAPRVAAAVRSILDGQRAYVLQGALSVLHNIGASVELFHRGFLAPILDGALGTGARDAQLWDEAVVTIALRVIADSLADPACLAAVAERQPIQALCERLTVAAYVPSAVIIVLALLKGGSSVTEVARCDGIRLAVNALTTPSSRLPPAARGNLALLLGECANEKSLQASLLSQGAVDVLVPMMDDIDDRVQRNAATACARMAQHPKSRERLKELHGIERMITVSSKIGS